MTGHINNFSELATTPNRKLALRVVEAGLRAIGTEAILLNSLVLEGSILKIQKESFDLSQFKRVRVIGFGKAAAAGATTLEKILGNRIDSGAVVGLSKAESTIIESFVGTHPKPSAANLAGGRKIQELTNNSEEDDLIIVLVSGGGSALLCSDENECEQSIKLYDSFLGSGKTIAEINTVRKHISSLKGGGLVRLAYPATVIGLIFSDIPGNNFANVASGPTYRDDTTIMDAERIIQENNLGEFKLVETPKEDKYFEKVHNFILVSNQTALEAMQHQSEALKLKTRIISSELYNPTEEAIGRIFSSKKKDSVILAGGEPRLLVPRQSGKGGRNTHMVLETLYDKLLDQDSVFISFSSDGMDNSDAAGAIADKNTIDKADSLGLSVADYLERFDSYSFFEQTGDLIKTGPTGANVSDLMLLLSKSS